MIRATFQYYSFTFAIDHKHYTVKINADQKAYLIARDSDGGIIYKSAYTRREDCTPTIDNALKLLDNALHKVKK